MLLIPLLRWFDQPAIAHAVESQLGTAVVFELSTLQVSDALDPSADERNIHLYRRGKRRGQMCTPSLLMQYVGGERIAFTYDQGVGQPGFVAY